jgi:uncharacterized metal-binding protein
MGESNHKTIQEVTMLFKQHLAAGTAAGIAIGTATLYLTNEPKTAIAAGLITLAGSLAPDLDCHSIPSRILSAVCAVITGLMIYAKNYQVAAWMGLVFFIIKAQKHRGLTHSYFLPITCYGLFRLGFYGAVPFGFGLVIHYILDGMSILSRKNWVSL